MVWVEVAPGRQVLVDTGRKAQKADQTLSRRECLTQKERKSLYLQTGKKFTTESEARKYLKSQGMRLEERGEPNEAARREQREWLRDTRPGERGPTPNVQSNGYVRWGHKDLRR